MLDEFRRRAGERNQTTVPKQMISEITIPDRLARTILKAARGSDCWVVNTGGSAGSTIFFGFGQKIPRDVPLNNPTTSDEYQNNEPEYSLLVWCSWRLSADRVPLVSSDSDDPALRERIATIVGKRLKGVSMVSGTHDLRVDFDNGLLLTVLCDRIDDDPYALENWQFATAHGTLAATAAASLVVEAENPSSFASAFGCFGSRF